MRIVCPSCNAQYEIDVTLLPDDGREVQCSACGTIWFQHGAATPTPVASVPAAAAPPAQPRQDTQPVAADTSDDTTPEDDTPVPEDTAPPDAAPRPKPVDPKVLDILRDEAEYEARQRARDAGGLETQPELGLLGAAPWPCKPDTLDDPDKSAERDDSPKSRAPTFPDIDDISETLEPVGRKRGKSHASEVPATSDEKKRSFLRGLVIPLAMAIVLVALYLAAPAMARVIPATAPVFTGYVEAVDGLRAAIVGMLGA